jgi:hypothetical protein
MVKLILDLPLTGKVHTSAERIGESPNNPKPGQAAKVQETRSASVLEATWRF